MIAVKNRRNMADTLLYPCGSMRRADARRVAVPVPYTENIPALQCVMINEKCPQKASLFEACQRSLAQGNRMRLDNGMKYKAIT